MSDVPVPELDDERDDREEAAADPDGHRVKPDPFDESNSPKQGG
jgi:hypothetical protein